MNSMRIALGMGSPFLGAPFLSGYLLLERQRCGDDFAGLALGPSRVGGSGRAPTTTPG
ncbi:MAG: hypothetical protein AAGC67_13090 [Myxococcota bacterium]